MKSTVLSQVVEHDLCIGCGLCAAMCPDKILTMQFNRYGEYSPNITRECKKECGICLHICPFSDGNSDEDIIGQQLFRHIPGIEYKSEIGYYLATLVGYSNVGSQRENGASGGMATWLLEKLIEKKLADGIACVVHNPDPEELFKFNILTKLEDVTKASGSAYYPVQLSDTIRFILENPGKYAIIGLPCFVKAIRLAQQRNRILHERIVFVLGLTCGQLKSKHYTAYLTALSGLEGQPRHINFRGKDLGRTARNFYFSCIDSHGKERRIYCNDGVSEVNKNRWFTPNACNYCDDVFAECADMTFMDAWLPEYYKDPRGTSLMIIRSLELLNLLRQKHNDEIFVDDINIQRVIRSQRSVISNKNSELAYRLRQGKSIRTPQKRIQSTNCFNPLKIWRTKSINSMQKISKQFIPNQYYLVSEIEELRCNMQPYITQMNLIALLNLPFRAFAYLAKLFARLQGKSRTK